jgi:Na+/proline symporter
VNPEFRPLRLIAEMMLFATAFSCQLLPVTVDMLFLNRGTKKGAIAGIAAGLLTVAVVLFCTKVVTEPIDTMARLSKLFDTGFIGFVVNVIVFAAVSAFTSRLPKEHVEAFVRDLTESEDSN